MNKRNDSIDALKFFCIIGVICIHTSPFNGMNLGRLINTIARVCVPLFFVSSGYTFYTRANKEYTIKYTMNLFKVLMSWVSIYIFYNITLMIASNIVNYRYTFTGVWEYLAGFKVSDIYYAMGIVNYHLWYLSTMVIIAPILYFIINKKVMNKAIIVTLALNIIGVLIPVLIDPDLWIRVRDALFFGLFYCILGAYIKENEYKFNQIIAKLSKFKHIIIILNVLGVSIIERGIYIVMFNGSGDYFISTILLAILVFGLCLRNPNSFKDTIISKLGKKTLGIYVIHPLIINVIQIILVRFNLDWISKTIIWQVIYTPIVLLISYISYEIIQVIKQRVINIKRKSKNRLGVNKLTSMMR